MKVSIAQSIAQKSSITCSILARMMAYQKLNALIGERAEEKTLPKFVLFGASLTQWSFSEETEGFGWFLENKYKGKAGILNEGG